MKKTFISHLSKGFLIIFGLLAIFCAYSMLEIAKSFAMDSPSIANLQYPLLIYVELLLVLFIIGIITLIKLLFLFDKNQVFSNQFVFNLSLLEKLCLFAATSMVIVFSIVNFLYVPLGLPGIYIFVTFLLIAIVGIAIHLIKLVVMDAMNYKDEIELTV